MLVFLFWNIMTKNIFHHLEKIWKKGIDHEVEEVLEIDIQKEKKNVVEKKEDDISTQWCRERDDSVPEL